MRHEHVGEPYVLNITPQIIGWAYMQEVDGGPLRVGGSAAVDGGEGHVEGGASLHGDAAAVGRGSPPLERRPVLQVAPRPLPSPRLLHLHMRNTSFLNKDICTPACGVTCSQLPCILSYDSRMGDPDSLTRG